MAVSTITQITDINTLAVGAVPIARGTSASHRMKFNLAPSQNNGRAKRVDATYAEITAKCEAQDPLSVPLVLALAFPQSFAHGGRVVSSSPTTWQTYTLLHCLLTSFGMTIEHLRPGSCSYEFANRALAAGTPATELAESVGARQGQIAREGTISVRSAVFTDDASASVTIPALSKIAITAKAGQVNAECSPGCVLADLVDVGDGWDITASLTIADSEIATAQATAQRLATMRRGTLVLTVGLTGQAAGAAVPVDKVVTISRLQLTDPGLSLSAGKSGVWDMSGNIELIDAAGVELALADIVTIEDAGG